MNSQLLATLPSATAATGFVRCFLMEYSKTGEGAIAWEFLYNPESVSTQKNARYSTTPVDGSLPSTEYGGPEPRAVTLAGLHLRAWYDGKSVSPLAEGLERLTLAAINTADAYVSPPVLSFVMGGRPVIAPCVVTQTNRVETTWWESGAIAEATVGFTLREVSQDDLMEGAIAPSIG